ncbi:hypothetical protein CCACVL1_16263 [Corchorus capsularis]|uniref:non-specific serine/threonine protein kinase n=1 Tax=Corchorus capsularis TaxID=210143 RepID=A0A1R3HY54_COCAP|nr:hypothetical protein CCACVL1_16263 [Corchorus capsularis]
MMQGLHQQQQQLAALLAAALPKDNTATATAAPSSSTPSTTTPSVPTNSDESDSARLAAINSLHRAILYPPNSILVAHSASFLSQGFSQLLSDKSYSVRQSAAIAYGALCAVVCSIPIGSSGRQNHVMLGSLVDRFINWALPLLSNISAGDGNTELALEGLREFLSVGDVGGIERYALSILKACQELLEDERTSLSLLHRLLAVLTLISLKFSLSFQPHFLDIIDLLLGWALVPDLAESDRRVIMDTFLQFQKHWVGNLQFSLGLLSKFLGDMDVLLQDGTHGTPQHFRRLLALLSCFCTVLQSTASGLLEMNLLEQISEPLSKMLPRLLGCLSVVGKKFGWPKWIEDSWKCLTLLAEILRERFCTFYPLAVDILFQSLELDSSSRPVGSGKISSFQVHGVLKTNLQLLSLQKLGLLHSSVQKILQFDAAISQLRLHPNHLITASSAATYVFLLQHGNDEIVQKALTLLTEELELLKGMLGKNLGHGEEIDSVGASRSYSKLELFALIKFDLKVLLTSVSLCGRNSLIVQPKTATLYLQRSENLVSFVIEKLNPFNLPIQFYVELQVNILKTLDRLSMVKFLSKCSIRNQSENIPTGDFSSEKVINNNSFRDVHSAVIFEYLKECGTLLAKALHISSPVSLKVVALEWVQRFCENLISISENSNMKSNFYEEFGHVSLCGNVIFSILEAAFDREPKVRLHVTLALELLLQARLIHPLYFNSVSDVVLEKLGDPDTGIRNAYVRLLSHVLLTTMYAYGIRDIGAFSTSRPRVLMLGSSSNLYWKQVFALKPLPQQLHSQQLVSILSYISQRWKVPLSSWIQRLIHMCRSSKDSILGQLEESGITGANDLWLDLKVEEDALERLCSVNNLAGAWWAIHEAARYCISTRLRTNLGGPTQTFAALERMLLDIAHVLQLDGEQNDGSLSIIGSSGAHLLPMRLLLDFVEALKKNVYNAYEGSAVLPSASRQSSLFFRANRKVCEEWFSRICEPMMNAGLALQCHDATIQYCTLRLQELKNLVVSAFKEKSQTQVSENLHNMREKSIGDILRVVRHMSLALCRNHEPEALVGLQKWVSWTFSPLLLDEDQSMNHSGILRHFEWITGLIYQAESQYEKAASHFAHLLQSEELLSTMGSDGVQFSIARIIESYTALSDWKSLDSWLLELQTLRAKHAGKSYSGALTTAGNEMNAIHALARFDEGDLQAAWAFLDLTPKSSSELTLDPKLALQRSEQLLLQALLLQIEGNLDKVPHELQKAKSMLEEILSVLPLDGLAEAAACVTQLHCIFAFVECNELTGNQGKLQEHIISKLSRSVLSSYLLPLQPVIKGIHQDCNPWLKVLRVYRTISPTSPVTLKLSMNLMNLARKQGNLMLANCLNNYMRDHVSNCSHDRYRNLLILKLQYEGILLMHSENKIEDAFANLWSFLRPCMCSSAFTVNDVDDGMLKAKACLKLSNWLRQDHSSLSFENIVLRMQADLNVANVSSIGIGGQCFNNENKSPKLSLDLIVEEIVGTATKLSTQLCPTMAKSWISYASWCFSQANSSIINRHERCLHSCSLSPMLVSEIAPERFKMTEDEIRGVEAVILPLFRNRDNVELVDYRAEEWNLHSDPAEILRTSNPSKALVQQLVDMMEAAAGAPGAENSGSERLSSTLTFQLKSSLGRSNVGEETDISSVIDNLISVWWSLRKRRVSLFGHAAHGFIKCLLHSSTKLSEDLFSGDGCESLKQNVGSYTLRATLYVLHILLNYGLELKDTLEPALSTIPLLSWQDVTPQLFARLSSHPEEVVRKQIESLLMMLAKLSPWSIVYPTLVDINAYEEKPSEELQHILGCLRELYPRLIQDVQLVINELGNVTVLWEELWLSTLQDVHMDVMRRINILKEEAARIAENATLSQSEKNKINAAKYSAMMAPIVVALERRLASTSRKPETPHELWFHQEYKEQLKSAILSFKTPPASAAALGDVWRPFDNIAASLASYQRKSSISLGEVAPQLAKLSSSDVPMPGLEKQVTTSEFDKGLTSTLQGIVTIASFSEQITILSTKTKPKKLVILGSDGKTYPYLLKGREDLRLDARIMQLLQAINSFLNSSSGTNHNLLGIRYYSVTPISGRAGLIQWVDNVISIYSIFKSWQNRAQLAQLSALGAGNAKSSVPPVPRPSDMFYGKIIPALKEKGIRRVISRRDWPHEVKRKVLLDLMKEVPKQLLHQELWCASDGFKAFSSKLKRYSGSVAAMSMVGHIMGLGDRHLDNILMDFSSGDVVHIDYNVCFDKGQRLKVPEIVPFRLTQTIEAALGLTGVEGTFRANCEAVVSVLRKNKDILLMLLEVFVWDPLIEWTRGDFHDDAAIGGEERKGMELAVSLSLFASRVQEIRVPLQEHHDLLLATLPAVKSALERFVDVLNQYELVSARFYRADQERSNLILHETSAKSMVAEATCNSEKIHASFEIQAREFNQAKNVVAEKAQQATSWIEQHGRILDALRGNLIPEMNACTNLSSMQDALSLTSAVPVAGVPLTIVPEPTQAQCYDIDREVSQLISELDSGLSSAVMSLQAYSLALQRVLPLNYLTTSTVHGWAQVLQLSVNAVSSEILSLARIQAAELIAKVHTDNLDFKKGSHDDLCFKVEKYAVEIEKVEEECAELVNSIGSETESKAKDRLMSAFTKYMQSAGLLKKEDANNSVQSGESKYDGERASRTGEKLEEKKDKVLSVLSIAVQSLYDEVKHRVLDLYNHITRAQNENNRLQSDLGTIFSEFEEQVEKCNLVAGFVNELWQHIGGDKLGVDGDQNYYSEGNWASIFKTILLCCKTLVGDMTEVVLPDVMRSAVSFNTEVMDAFGFISQIRGSIDTALEQLVEVELERASLAELEKNYFVKVGLITEQQLALEEAAMKGRDHLSWEEAEELASQEEACRAQLDQLHQSWNQRDMRTSSLIKREAQIKSSLVSCEHHFQTLVSGENFRESHHSRSKVLLAILVKPFSELESVDKALSTLRSSFAPHADEIPNLVDSISSGRSVSECIWNFGALLNDHSFFIWKIGVLDSILDSCIHDVASSVDQNLGFEQLFNVVKRKLEIQLQKYVGHYLRIRVAPALLSWLDKENEHLKLLAEGANTDHVRKDVGAVKRVQLMLEEYCNTHETARAARSAASVMKRQVNELKEALRKTTFEIVQMEWMHDVGSTPSQSSRILFQKFFSSDDELYPIVLNLSRPKLLETMQTVVSKIARSLEGLQSCDHTSLAAEGQLERAMGWACGGPNSGITGNSSAKASGIPPEFHEHLMRRRHLLREAREKASNIVKICMSILEFEASRDGIFQIPGEAYALSASGDSRTWQQAYFSALTKLEVTYHSFTRTEQEWKLAQSNMEVASTGLYSATNELCIASLKAKSASAFTRYIHHFAGDLQSTVLAMRDCAYEASVALSAFARVSRGHTALTTESGSMLEEVLAITEDLHDVHNLGKEAAAVHHSLMEDLSKANSILLPLESVLSKDVSAMTEAMSREQETKMEVSPIHGQAIYQSYGVRVRETCQTFKTLVPSLTFSVKELHSLLTTLARTASLHAGNLHKALEGLGESQEVKSQGIRLSRPDLAGDATESDERAGESISTSGSGSTKDFVDLTGLSLQDKEWISLPDSIGSSSSSVESGVASNATSLSDGTNDPAEVIANIWSGFETKKADDGQTIVPSSQSEYDKISHFGQRASKNDEENNSDAATNEPTEYVKVVLSVDDEAVNAPLESSQPSNKESLDLKFGGKDEASTSNIVEVGDESHEVVNNTQTASRIARGKNAYAMSVLKRVEMKLDGRDITERREISIAEQVDYLLKQATSVDNLCSMYEEEKPSPTLQNEPTATSRDEVHVPTVIQMISQQQEPDEVAAMLDIV